MQFEHLHRKSTENIICASVNKGSPKKHWCIVNVPGTTNLKTHVSAQGNTSAEGEGLTDMGELLDDFAVSQAREVSDKCMESQVMQNERDDIQGRRVVRVSEEPRQCMGSTAATSENMMAVAWMD